MRRTRGRRRTGGCRGALRRTASAGRADTEYRALPLPSLRRFRSHLLPERVAGETANPDVLADRGDLLGDQVADRALLVTERLVEQADLRVPLLELALDDLRPDVLGLLLDRLVGEQLGLLRGKLLGRDVLGVDVDGSESRDLDREVAHQLLELVRARHEVRLAVDLDEHADAPAGMDVARHEALAGVAIGLLGCRCETLVAQDEGSLVEVAVSLGERALAIHEPGARSFAQFLDELGRDVRHACS